MGVCDGWIVAVLVGVSVAVCVFVGIGDILELGGGGILLSGPEDVADGDSKRLVAVRLGSGDGYSVGGGILVVRRSVVSIMPGWAGDPSVGILSVRFVNQRQPKKPAAAKAATRSTLRQPIPN